MPDPKTPKILQGAREREDLAGKMVEGLEDFSKARRRPGGAAAAREVAEKTANKERQFTEQSRKSRPGDAATDKLPVVNKGQPLFKSGSTWSAR